MSSQDFHRRLRQLRHEHETLLSRTNPPQAAGNGIYHRHANPVLTAAHTPLEWRYDLDPAANPHLMTRLGVNCVFNVLFANGWVARENGELLLYYGSSDTHTHVASTTVEKMLDYVKNTPPDAGRTRLCVEQRCEMIRRNLALRNSSSHHPAEEATESGSLRQDPKS